MTVGTRIRMLSVVVLLLTTAAIAGSRVTSQAHAHDSNVYVARWPTTAGPLDVVFQEAQSVSNLSASRRTAIRFGAAPWNALETSLNMGLGPALNTEPDHKDCASGVNSLHWQAIDGRSNPTNGSGTILAQTWMCYVAPWPGLGEQVYRMLHAAIVYDRDENWYFGTVTPGSAEHDMRGVSTHEFGHFAGWRLHLSGVCSSPRHTMCPTIPPGTNEWRTLETHDTHTFRGAYP